MTSLPITNITPLARHTLNPSTTHQSQPHPTTWPATLLQNTTPYHIIITPCPKPKSHANRRCIINHTRSFQNRFSHHQISHHQTAVLLAPHVFASTSDLTIKGYIKLFHNIICIVISHPVEVTWPRSEEYIRRPLCRRKFPILTLLVPSCLSTLY